MVAIATGAVTTRVFDEKALRLTLAEIARQSHRDDTNANQATEIKDRHQKRSRGPASRHPATPCARRILNPDSAPACDEITPIANEFGCSW